MELNFSTNIRAFQKGIDAAAKKQLPWAAAVALTETAKAVSEAEKDNAQKVLDRPRPFTTGAFRVIRASKATLHAKVVVMDLTAAYLEPYEFGGKNKLNGRSVLTPIASVSDLDKFGNLPRRYLDRLKARSDVFVGKVEFRKSGQTIWGVWQRPPHGDRSHLSKKDSAAGRIKGTKGALRDIGGVRTGLKLLIRFTDAHEAEQNLAWFDVARATADAVFDDEFRKALSKALATAKK